MAEKVFDRGTGGQPGGHVVAFASSSCVLASTSKNALGLCFMGPLAP